MINIDSQDQDQFMEIKHLLQYEALKLLWVLKEKVSEKVNLRKITGLILPRTQIVNALLWMYFGFKPVQTTHEALKEWWSLLIKDYIFFFFQFISEQAKS